MHCRQTARFAGYAITVLLLAIFIGCSGTSDTSAVTPGPSEGAGCMESSSHSLLGFWIMTVNDDHTEVTAHALRTADMHFNVRTYMEDGPCVSCISILGVHPVPPNMIDVNIELRHPFPGNTWLTGFDVRGIAMFPGSCEFPVAGLTTSGWVNYGNAELLNADGFTRLFNPVEYAPGTKPINLHEYSKGKYAAGTGLTSTLNGFKYFSTNYGNRNYFSAGDVIKEKYRIVLSGGPLTFGYAVDISWAAPSSNPPSVPGDFPLKANCAEAYEISVVGPMSGYYIDECPDSTGTYRFFIRDHQGGDTIQDVRVECPAVFDGQLHAVKYGTQDDPAIYDITITNENATSDTGIYKMLVEVEDINTHPYLDLVGYQLADLIIMPNWAPEADAWVEGGGIYETGEQVQFHSNALDLNGPDDIAAYMWDFDGDGNYEDLGPDPVYQYDIPGIYYVGFKVIDLCGEEDPLDSPLVVTIIKPPVEITLPEDKAFKTVGKDYHYATEEMLFSQLPIDISDLDGPWDFTVLELPDQLINKTIVGKNDPEVSAVSGFYNPAVTHFLKYSEQIYDITGAFYEAEEHNVAQNVLKMWGIYEPEDLGAVAFPSPIVTPFPINIDTDVHDEVGIVGYAQFIYDFEVLGVGQVTVPYGGNTSYDALMVRMYLRVETPDSFNASGLIYEWIEDDGKSVAMVIAMDMPDDGYDNFDDDTLEYYATGSISVNALDTIDG